MDQKTMDLDNPSYFSVCSETHTFVYKPRMGNTDSVSSASDSSLTRQLTPPKSKKPLRSFLRSVSSNSADSNQELLIMGQPRLSDIAPDLAFKHPVHVANKTKSDVLYSALPTSEAEEEEEEADEVMGDEVFLNEDSAKYYNYSVVKPSNQRRHSVGTFMERERSNSIASSSKSFRDNDFPQGIIHATSDGGSVGASSAVNIDDHSLRHASYPRKRCSKCTRGTNPKPANMDDILIVSLKCSEAATLWVEYFTSYFQQISSQARRDPFKIRHLWAENSLNEIEEPEKTAGVKLQLIVLCPGFLEFVSENPEQSANLGKLMLPDRTLALLLGVSDSDLHDNHKKALPTYYQWQRRSVGQDQDENFTKEFLGQAMTTLSRVWKQQCAISGQEKSNFSVSPKKIRQGQNSVFILLTYPLQKEDIVKISIEKNNEIFEVKSVKRRNPYTIKITVPDNLTEVTAIVNILVEKNGSIVGSRPIKCESKFRELEQILRSTNHPVEFMCQTLGFNPSNKEQLDNWLLHAFQRNLPTHFNLLANHSTPFAAAVYAHKHSHEEYPTLLHFAAKFGLEKLAMQLLDCPGADVAYDIKNVHDMTPAEIAESNCHVELANSLRGYMKMNEFSNMYAKLKEMSLNTSKIVDESGYLTPKTINELYKICPAPRPVISSPATTPTAEYAPSSGYMSMNTPVQVIITEDSDSAKKTNDTVAKSDKNLSNLGQQQPKQTNCEFVEDKFLKELLEIMNDFKNHVHSIGQVEKLFDEWKNRNDVQKSFKEKQEQLNEMRLKYEKIQLEMKASMKKSTPFERIKKLFSRSKSREEKFEVSLPSTITVPSQRPISSLSTSSSESSGRMSTISGSSLGDSGTHSDNEERKNILGICPDEDFRTDLNKIVMELNYTPVPAPKPVKGAMMFNRNKLFETIEEKPVQASDMLPVNEEYYIQFPPSGLPVLDQLDNKINGGGNEYMNINSNINKSSDLLTENREYMNFKIVTNR